MPLVKDSLVTTNPTSSNTPTPIQSIKITSETNAPVAVDNRWVSRINLLSHIAGSSWVVDYYSQILTKDSQLTGQQLTVSPANQQYTKINNFVLKVTSALTSRQKEDNSMEVVGEAIVNPALIPNSGDMFTADIGESRLGVFQINKTTKLSIFKQACYQIGYVLITDSVTRLNDLNDKVVKQTYYHDDFNLYGNNPIIVQENHNNLIELQEEYRKLIEYYFKRFYSNEFKTILIPKQSVSVYDPFLVSFLMKEINTSENILFRNVIKYNTNEDDNLKSDTIWDCINHRDITYLESAMTKYTLKDVRTLSSTPVTKGIRYTGIRKIIYPYNPVVSVDKTIDNTLSQLDKLLDIDNQGNNQNNNTNYYIFSDKFYDKTTAQMSAFELLVYRYIINEPSDSTKILELCKTYKTWSLLKQLYYLPMLIVMVRSILNGEI